VNKSFNLVITDIRMPGLSYPDVLPGIKKIQPEIPIVVIQAFGNKEMQRKTFQRGGAVFSEKPIFFGEF
jgi:two-component system C4-dicarboxylate transport response regulator DctD